MDLGLGDQLSSQVQAQVIEQRKKKQQQQQMMGGSDALSTLLNGVTPATASLYGKTSGFGNGF